MRHPLSTGWPAMAHDLNFPSHLFFDPLPPLACVALIHPHFFHTRKQVLDRLKQGRHAFPILDIGLMDRHFEQQTRRIDEDVSLPARELLAAIVAVRSTSVRASHRLTIDDASRRGGF